MISRDFAGWKIREYALLLLLIAVQAVNYVWNPVSLIAMVGGMCGVVCVVLTAKAKISNYVFGFVSSIVIFYSAIQAKVYAEMPLQIFYMVVDIVSLIVWFKVSDDHTGSPKQTRRFKGGKKYWHGIVGWMWTFDMWVLLYWVSYAIVMVLGDKQPMIDSAAFATGASAMIMLLMQYRENFVLWIAANVLSIILWFRAGSYTGAGYALFLMYCCYFVNSCYGLYNWMKLSKRGNQDD